MCRVIAVSNQKGGVGKTVSCVNLGIGLAQEGKKVLLIDADPQGSLTISLGYEEPDEMEYSLATLMMNIVNDEKLNIEKTILHHKEGVDLIPANIELSAIEVSLVNAMSRELILRSMVDRLREFYDYIIIDCILLFGCEAQQQLREFSKIISNQLLNSNGDLEYLIHDILNEIDDFQVSIEKKVGIFPGSNEKKRERLIKKYNEVLVYMDKMELALKLQEAQLIKDSKLFEELSRCIDETLSSLQTTISYGNDVVNQKPKGQIPDDIKTWYERISKRIEDLGISHTVALQTKTQMNLMLENNTRLIDKIMGAVSGTIPIWRNQITILLGIEKMNRNLEIQNRVAEITQKYITKEKNIGRKKYVESTELCVEKLMNTNETIKKVLDDLDSMEKKDGGIRLELSDSLR